MIGIPSLLRLAEHEALKNIRLSGLVLDLGADANSNYLSFVSGVYTVTRVNLDPKTRPDILHDLEKPLPILDAQYDGVVLFNVLEHIFNYRELLSESVRVLRPRGTMVLVVPFLFPIHPSPNDFQRFSSSTLRTHLMKLGLIDIHVQVLGKGVWSACYLLIDRLLPHPVRILNFYSLRFFVLGMDYITLLGARMLGKKYDPADYALGYCVTAHRP